MCVLEKESLQHPKQSVQSNTLEKKPQDNSKENRREERMKLGAEI